MSWLERIDPRSYSFPVLVAVVIHLLILAVLSFNWGAGVETVKAPAFISAKVIQVESKTKKPRPTKKKNTQPKKKPKPKPKPKADTNKAISNKKNDSKLNLNQTTEKAETKPKVADAPIEDEIDTSAMEDELQRALDDEQALQVEQDELVANSYIDQIRAQISRVWQYPPSARRDMSTTVRIQMVPTGEVVSVSVTKSSGVEALDRSVELAVKKAQPLPVPKDSRVFEASFRVINITFKPEDARY